MKWTKEEEFELALNMKQVKTNIPLIEKLIRGKDFNKNLIDQQIAKSSIELSVSYLKSTLNILNKEKTKK